MSLPKLKYQHQATLQLLGRQPSIEAITNKYVSSMHFIQLEGQISTQYQNTSMPNTERPSRILPAFRDLEIGPNYVHLERFKFSYFQLCIKEMKSPLRVFITQAKLRIYGSTSNPHPNKFNSEFITSQLQFKYDDRHHSSIFHDDCLYLAIYTDEDTSLTLTTQFGNAIKLKTQLRVRIEEDPLPSLNQSITTVYKKTIEVDVQQFTRINKYLKQVHQKEQLEQKLKLARRRHKQITIDRSIYVESKIIATHQLKEIRKAQLIRDQNYQVQTKFKHHWFDLLYLIDLMAQFIEKIDEAKHQYLIMAQARLIAWTYSTKTLLKLKQSGATVQERHHFRCNLTMKMIAKIVKKRARQQMFPRILHALKTTHLPLTFLQVHKRNVQNFNMVKRVYRSYIKRVHRFKEKHLIYLLKHGNEITQQIFGDAILIKHIIFDKYIKSQNRALLLSKLDYAIKERKIKFAHIFHATKMQAIQNILLPNIFQELESTEIDHILRNYVASKRLL